MFYRIALVSLFLLFMVGPINSAHAQVVPIVNSSDGSYVLNIPYLEYQNDSNNQAYAATLISSDLQHFTISSVSSLNLLTHTSNTPKSSINAGQFQLSIPYLQVADASQKFRVNLTAGIDLSLFSVDSQSVQTVFTASSSDFSNLISLAPSDEQSLAGALVGSSTQLLLTWTQPENVSIDHYEISVLEENNQRENRILVSKDGTSSNLTELKSDTNYSALLYACSDASCNQYAIAQSQTVRTAKEHWQLQGSGNSVSGLTAPVSDGNARISATRIGPDAGTTNANTVQLYYGPFPQAEQNSTLAVATGIVSATNSLSQYLNFDSLAYQAGLISPISSHPPENGNAPTPPNPPNNNMASIPNPINKNLRTDLNYINQVATGQGVPLANGKIRLFFEALGSDQKTRIFWLDSQDGFLGQDFNPGSAGTCSTSADYASGGDCEPTLAIGIEGDSIGANQKLINARQQKVGFPTQSDWRWDMSAGTFMVFTADKVEDCSESNFNHAYAVWDGESHWKVQYDDAGCPKMFISVQACLPMHIGGVRYKMYCGDPSQTTGKVSSGNLPYLGPKQLIYADGSTTGDIGIVEFEDWESQSLVRDVVFVWPDGSEFSVADEGYIDDYHFLAPTGDLSYQVMYMAITDGTAVPVAATAILLNP